VRTRSNFMKSNVSIVDAHRIVVFIGAMAHGYATIFCLPGHLDSCAYRPDTFADHLVDDKIAISEYSLSASVRVLTASCWTMCVTSHRSHAERRARSSLSLLFNTDASRRYVVR
jgi:hypothetical protein